ncbi:MAG: kynureninase [Lewinellaceae bacterium]|nr:kynureninase [Saprospiraceae bacterium]MCB9340739.1 kynureninase [Lewinellaceae bacterium]
MNYQPTLSYAHHLDKTDPLRPYRRQFYFPKHKGKSVLYFCGNSLGLQPKGVKEALEHEVMHWREHAVEGHFRGEMPWMYYHKFLLPQSARLVGAKESEVVVMNTLTTNLHLLMVSFYRPTKERFKIIMEAGAFPSDQYAMESQVRFHGFSPKEAIVEIAPRPGEETLRTEDIISTIEKHGNSVATVMFGGVNYYTGQFFDLGKITEAGHKVGANVGFDLAHTAGNLPLKLHDWNVDFACWCSYKYLNSGPGGPSGIFVHERHGDNPDLPRFAGWWGHDEGSRFLMKKGFIPMQGAAGWQLSNAQIFSCAAHKVSLDMFDKVGMDALREKAVKMTGYLEFLIENLNKEKKRFNIITPSKPQARGCQLSILTGKEGKQLFDYLTENGVVADWREPNVIRVAPVPFYNSFEDCWRLADLLGKFNQ